ncbi:MAG: T9SS type A sorting domain-containing protein [Sphingobacteriales bacterium]|nr:MAG: T9SS type A sorting domain-containing protein [Sphingobacteriales bacterium]
MKKHFLPIAYLLGSLSVATPVVAQNTAILPEFQLPVVMGPVLRPQNASSSTMQQVVMPSGATENLYIHTWDVYSSANNNGIAWRRTNAGGGLIMQSQTIIPYAEDIDAVIYEQGGAYYVLAAYYYNNGLTGVRGHRYDVYRFDPGGLTTINTLNVLSSSPTFGRINVDASRYGRAITWCQPGAGIFVKAANTGGAFGGTVLLPGTANMVHPDLCIRRGGGGSGSGLDIQLAAVDASLTVLREYRVPFSSIVSGVPAGFAAEYGASSPGPRYNPPRIECPDVWGGGQRWAVSIGWNDYTGGTATERVEAHVMNGDFSPSPTVVTVAALAYASPSFELCDPVVTYNRNSDVITVGWMTQQPTSVLPGSSDKKYLAMDIKDVGTSFPATIPGTFNMISNSPASYESVLAFSGQNMNSDFNGVHTAFSQSHPSSPGYCMKYKNRPFGMTTFSDQQQMNLGTGTNDIAISPNPFSNAVSFTAPAKGDYAISLTSLEGRVVYTHNENLSQGQTLKVGTQDMAAGTYIMNIRSIENNINKIEKLVKQ